MKILLVDDEKTQRELLRGFLENQGYEVVAAADGLQALEIMAAVPVALVLLDHKMPGLAGDEVLARMKEMNPEIRALMITAYGDVDTAVKVMKLGADDFLSKPVNLETLLAKIRKIEQDILVIHDVEAAEKSVEDGPLPIGIIARSTVPSRRTRRPGSEAPTKVPTVMTTSSGTRGCSHHPVELPPGPRAHCSAPGYKGHNRLDRPSLPVLRPTSTTRM